jgi:hypothetical protein
MKIINSKDVYKNKKIFDFISDTIKSLDDKDPIDMDKLIWGFMNFPLDSEEEQKKFPILKKSLI